MKNWTRRLVVALTLGSLIGTVPMMSGCKADEKEKIEKAKARPDFVDTSDPTKLKMGPIGGPGDANKK